MSYLIGKSDINKKLVLGLGTVMIITLVFSIIGCFRMRSYFNSTVARARDLAGNAPGGPHIGLLFGESVATYVHPAIATTFGLLALAWLLFAVVFG
jgi:hypothetical protein